LTKTVFFFKIILYTVVFLYSVNAGMALHHFASLGVQGRLHWQTRGTHPEPEHNSVQGAVNRAVLWFTAKSLKLKSMYYVYILKSSKDGKLYTGRTNKLQQRLNQHLKGLVKSTKNRRPLKIIFYEAFKDKSDTIRRESYFKTSKGKKALRLMLRESLK